MAALRRGLSLERSAGLPAPAGATPSYWVGFSGGLDSSVLLDALVELRRQEGLSHSIRAVHVDHGLAAESAHWRAHCEQRAAALSVPLLNRRLDADRLSATGSVEAQARTARYAVFEDLLEPGDCLLLAHHANDQAETLLLRLLQGRGPVPMPAQRPLGAGSLRRPLLALPRTALKDYAAARAMSWIEDPSNAQTDPDRNYLRHTVLPACRVRWPDAVAGLARSGAAAQATQTALEAVLEGCSAVPVRRCRGAAGIALLRAFSALQGAYEGTDRAFRSFCEALSDEQHAAPRLTLSRRAGGSLELYRAQDEVRFRLLPAPAGHPLKG